MPDGSRPRSGPVAERYVTPDVTVVTGASGWLGRALVHRLLADPSRKRLRLLAHTTAEARQLQMLGDIAKPDTAARLLHRVGSDVDVIHTVGVIHPRTTRQFFETNATGTRHLVEAALDHRVRRLVHISSNSP